MAIKKAVPTGAKGLSKLPTGVRNKMGYMKNGGVMKKKKGYAKGGAAKMKMMYGGMGMKKKKGMAKGGKVGAARRK
jgi:hypothetical protein